jgi:hypothetical protein
MLRPVRFGHKNGCAANHNIPTRSGILVLQDGEDVKSMFPGGPSDPDQPGAPTASRYCGEHFAARLDDILSRAAGNKLEARPRDW